MCAFLQPFLRLCVPLLHSVCTVKVVRKLCKCRAKTLQMSSLTERERHRPRTRTTSTTNANDDIMATFTQHLCWQRSTFAAFRANISGACSDDKEYNDDQQKNLHYFSTDPIMRDKYERKSKKKSGVSRHPISKNKLLKN